jgi:hypothetical protein
MSYVKIEFENANARSTESIMLALEDDADYSHITGNTGWLIGEITTDMSTFTGQAQGIIHAQNNGMWVGVEEVSYEEIEHLL